MNAIRTILLLLAALVLAPLADRSPVEAQIPDSFTNLQVLPQSIRRDSLIGIMRDFSFALGVRCQYCHVGGDGVSFEGVRFADDDDEDKRKARYMLRMVDRLNGELLAQLPDRDQPPVDVQCVTCHGGLSRPRTIEAVMIEALTGSGADSAITLYRRLRTTYYGSGAYDFRAQRLNEVASRLAAQRRHGDAERMLLLNLEFHPSDLGTYGSLSEVRLQRADTAGAIAALQKFLELDPQNAEARRRLDRIRR